MRRKIAKQYKSRKDPVPRYERQQVACPTEQLSSLRSCLCQDPAKGSAFPESFGRGLQDQGDERRPCLFIVEMRGASKPSTEGDDAYQAHFGWDGRPRGTE